MSAQVASATAALDVGAHYNQAIPAVVVSALTITDQTVVAEARRWSTGRRGTTAEPADMRNVDLSPYVIQALSVGAHAISLAGGVQDTFNLEHLIADVGSRSTTATSQAAAATEAVVNAASKAMQEASSDARREITDAAKTARTDFAENVRSAQESLHTEIARLVGGEHPELMERFRPLIDKFSRDLQETSATATDALFAKAAKQFDPDESTSPMAKHTSELRRQQDALKTSFESSYQQLQASVNELTSVVQVANAAKGAAAAVAARTTLKGDTYEQGINLAMHKIADGLGEEYLETGLVDGKLPRSKKGDGVLIVNAGKSAVVVEMTNSLRPKWNEYLDEAERNRGAQASLGLVPDPALLKGNSIQCLGARRILLAFDPGHDDPTLLRTVVQLLRLGAISASSRLNSDDLETAEENIQQALVLTEELTAIKKLAEAIHRSADKIGVHSDTLYGTLQRLLTAADTALAAVSSADSPAAA